MTIKAYIVSDDENSVIRFAKSNVAARREGANELGAEFGSVSCVRAPYADAYADTRKVPNEVLMAHGWWFGCAHCAKPVFADDEDGPPVLVGDDVFCGQGCCDAQAEAKAERARLKQELVDAVLAHWPEAEIAHASSHDKDRRCTFLFGGRYSAIWRLGEDKVSIAPSDLHQWLAFDCRQKALTDSEAA